MKSEEIKEEIGLGVRCFLESQEKSLKPSIDQFEELRILETAFNRLFLAVEHFCNALLLLEMGSFSHKHFSNIAKLKEMKEKYNLDIANIYHQTYTFRAYADYRKFPEIKENFDRAHLKVELEAVKTALESILNVLKNKLDLSQFQEVFKTR